MTLKDFVQQTLIDAQECNTDTINFDIAIFPAKYAGQQDVIVIDTNPNQFSSRIKFTVNCQKKENNGTDSGK